MRTRIVPDLLHRLDSTVHEWLRSTSSGQEAFTDRAVERPFVFSNLPEHGRVLDVGCIGSDLPVIFTALGLDVVGIDIRPYDMLHPPFQFVKGDIRITAFRDESFDVVTAVSTIEHIGLSGRYGSDEDSRGDQRAMEEIHRVTKPGGTLLLTVPYGRPATFAPWHRVYGPDQLERLTNGFRATKFTFFVPDDRGLYRRTGQDTASDYAAFVRVAWGRLDYSYALACMVLRRA